MFNFVYKFKLQLLFVTCLQLATDLTRAQSTGYLQVIDVYYETLCPDSKRFLINQVPTILNEFGSKIKINLVPFGKANVSKEKKTISVLMHSNLYFFKLY